MSTSIRRSLAAWLASGALVLAFPAAAAATITGGCTGTGTSTSSSVDLTTATEWHMNSTDTAGGTGTSTVPMKSASVAAYAFGGLSLPIASGSGDGDTSGSVEGKSVAAYAILGHRFFIHGQAAGDGGAACSGDIDIVLDDVNPIFTVLGGGGLLLAVIGLLAILLGARSGGGCLIQLLAAAFGDLGGAGLSLSLAQFDVLDPRSIIGLGILALGAILGFALCGRFGSGSAPAAA